MAELAVFACPQCGTACEQNSTYCDACGVQLASAADQSVAVATNTVVGSYRLLEQIGEGGMGRVFIAEHTRLGRRVALKMLRSEYAGNVEAVKRFFAEARAVNRIKHENIIEISDFIENESGHACFIMELLTGVDLRRVEDKERVLPLARALHIAIQVCRGLAAAHEAGIVHRDLKPDNIFLVDRSDRKDVVKLLDFGVAKLMDPAMLDVSTFKTNAGIVIGTPLYMSPEQAVGKPVDHRTDIYALGVILFEMVTGQRPFHADSFGELLVKHVTTPPPRPSRVPTLAHVVVPRPLEELILACMAKDADARPQTMRDVARQLEEMARQLAATGEIRGGRRFDGRRAVAWVGASLAGLAVAGGIATFVVRHHGGVHPRPTAQAAFATVPVAPRPRVEIAFDSDPTGASVFLAGATEPLGTTPFAAAFEASPRTQTFEFRAEGRRPARRDVSLQRDAHIEVLLARDEATATDDATATARRRGSPPKPNPLDRDLVLNPFK